ncbi:MAG: oxidoreductase [Rariglobus sp.]|jgi:predicted dehydrogenase|nr:oxidoreductase [Rariglobus sp.]
MIRLGLIGLGQRLAHMVTCFQASDPSLRVVGVVDPDRAGALSRLPESERSSVRFFDTLEELLREARPDALAIGTRCNLHAPVATAAASSGLPLFLEKPVAISLSQARALEHTFARSRSQVVVSFPLRVSHLCRMAKTRIEAGEIGRLEHVLGVNYVPYGNVYFDSWYRDYQITQGLFLQKATHDFDYLSCLAGAPIVRVAAMAQQGRVFRDRSQEPAEGDDSRAYFENIGRPETGMNEDASSALLEFANGIHGVYTQIFYSKHEAQARGATLSGLRGTLRFDWYQNELRLHSHAEAKTLVDHPPEGLNHFGGDGVLADNFIDVIRGRAPSASPLSAGLQSVYACLAARESAATGRFVTVQPLTDLAPAPLPSHPHAVPSPNLTLAGAPV